MPRKKVCWNITARCNQNCKYCHRFLDIKELDFYSNKKILENLIKNGITDITWTGGEALLYPNLIELLKISKENGVKNKLITNGLILSKSKNIEEICNSLDYLTLSIDSIDSNINKQLGRGAEHYNTIKNILDYVNDKKLSININTVICKNNVDKLGDLGKFLNNYKIDTWKFFKFMPIRETAEKNKEIFEIKNTEFKTKENVFKKFQNISNIVYKEQNEFEKSYLIIANGDIIKTENGRDIIKGNALKNNVVSIME